MPGHNAEAQSEATPWRDKEQNNECCTRCNLCFSTSSQSSFSYTFVRMSISAHSLSLSPLIVLTFQFFLVFYSSTIVILSSPLPFSTEENLQSLNIKLQKWVTKDTGYRGGRGEGETVSGHNKVSGNNLTPVSLTLLLNTIRVLTEFYSVGITWLNSFSCVYVQKQLKLGLVLLIQWNILTTDYFFTDPVSLKYI